MNQKKNNKWDVLIIAVFVLLFVSLGAAHLLTPDRESSENENRPLQTLPSLSKKAVFEGVFDDQVEDYLADQFWNRDGWTALRSDLKRALLQKDIGGVYLGQDGYYIEKRADHEIDRERLSGNLAALRAFYERCSKTLPPERLSFLLVPTPGYVLKDKLPPYAELFDEDAVFEEARAAMAGFSFLDLREPFLSADSPLYYRTDHHWTTSGALAAYRLWQTSHGEPLAVSDYKVERHEGFRGTLYSKVLNRDAPYDTVELYRFPGDDALSVTYEGKEHSSCYAWDALKEKDMYQVFFGGNYPLVEIKGQAENGRHLLVLKDSYANSFLPFAAADYETITVVDLRYYLGFVDPLLEERGITDVLTLYSTANFLSDANVGKLLIAPQ